MLRAGINICKVPTAEVSGGRKVPRTDIGCRLAPPQDALTKLAQDASAKKPVPEEEPVI